MLPFYAQRFSAVELNSTWYQMPQAEAIERQRLRAPPDFIFTAKLTRSLTHDVEPERWREQAAEYRAGVAPLLFLQTLMGQFFFTSSILMGWGWFSVVVVLIFAFYVTYLQSFRGPRLGRARTPLLAATSVFTTVAFST